MKEVRLRFCKLLAREQEAIDAFIAKNISADKTAVDQQFNPQSPNEKRAGVRVFLNNFQVKVNIAASPTIKAQSFDSELADLSGGGCCIRVAQDVKLTKNSKASISLDFILPGLTTEVEILGLQYDD
ncbi:MAG: PilZ domain-containing protein [Oligoflexales bacterium]|nr:PilZ domain-containing protein [Oligoflexales bacterium]